MLVTAGYEADATYAAAAYAGDGCCALVYLPTNRTITVNLGMVRGPIVARWFDPTNGAFLPVGAGPTVSTAAQLFTPPQRNSANDADWVLVLDQAQQHGS
jgi:hypothetical protein